MLVPDSRAPLPKQLQPRRFQPVGGGETYERLVVGIGAMQVSNSLRHLIITHSLGSCVGLTLYDPEACVGGMVHCLLPLSRAEPERAKTAPCTFTDTGVIALLRAVLELGARRDRLLAKVAGAGKMLPGADCFKTSQRNYTVLRKVLWKNDILITGERVGGTDPKTMVLYMDTGRVATRTRGVESEL